MEKIAKELVGVGEDSGTMEKVDGMVEELVGEDSGTMEKIDEMAEELVGEDFGTMEKIDEMVEELVGEDSGKMEKAVEEMVRMVEKVVELGGGVKVGSKVKVAEVDDVVQPAGMDCANQAKILADKCVVLVENLEPIILYEFILHELEFHIE